MATLHLNNDFGLTSGGDIKSPLDSAVGSASAGDTITCDTDTYTSSGTISNGAKAITIDLAGSTIDVQSGVTYIIDGDGSGWTIRNFTVDSRTNYSNFFPRMSPTGSNWTMEFITYRKDPTSATSSLSNSRHVLTPNVNSGSTGTLRNIYAPDAGAPVDFCGDDGWLWCGPSMEGTLEVVGMYAVMWPNNTFYTTNTPGQINLRDSYFENSNVGLRVAGGALVENTMVNINGNLPQQGGSQNCGSEGRGIWTNPRTHSSQGTLRVDNSKFHYVDATDASLPINIDDPIDNVEIVNNKVHFGFGTNETPLGGSESNSIELSSGNLISGSTNTPSGWSTASQSQTTFGDPAEVLPSDHQHLGGGGSSSPTPPSAPVIDDFNQEAFDWWQVSDTAVWGFTTSPVREGSALEHTGSWGQVLSEPSQTTALNNYFSKGERSKIAVYRNNSNSYWVVSWGVTDSTNRYSLLVDFSTSEARLFHLNGSTTETVLGQDTSITPQTNTWYEVDIVWDDGTLGGNDNDISVTVTDLSNGSELTALSANDSTHATSTGVQLAAGAEGGSGNFTVFDNWREVATEAATNVTIIEDWEDGTLSSWSGTTSVYDVATDLTYNGVYSLRNDGSWGRLYSLAGSGLNHYFAKGEKMRVYGRKNHTTGMFNIGYGYQGDDARYSVILDWDTDEIRFYKQTPNASGEVQIDTIHSTAGLVANVWYEVEVVWDDGTLGGADNDHTVTVTDVTNGVELHTFTGNDAEFATETGMQLAADGSGVAGNYTWIDYEHVYTSLGNARDTVGGVIQTSNGVIDIR